jgi:AraC-like DNA-binding protein
MEQFSFRSDDVAETEAFLTSAYTPMRLERVPRRARAHVSRRAVEGVSIDEVSVGFDMAYDANPLDHLLICSIHEGTITEQHVDGRVERYGPGEVVWLTPPGLPYAGVAHRARYTVLMLDPSLVADAAGSPVHLASDRPRSREAGQRLRHTISWMRDHVLDTAEPVPELVRVSATRSLAATVLDAFGSTDDDSATTYGVMPATVRRAVSFMESELHSPIGVVEIATAARVTPRALQYAFRQHLDSTPLTHLRRMRLQRAREQLRCPDDNTTVTATALRCGFTHLGRFAASYREQHGETPAQTLARARHEPGT